MHEMSIVMSMIDLCEKHAKGREIKTVAVNIGKLSGIEPHFLSSTFEIFRENSKVCKNAELDMNIIDIKILCLDCNKKYTIDNYNFYCPECKGSNTKTVSGEEMHIDHIELKD